MTQCLTRGHKEWFLDIKEEYGMRAMRSFACVAIEEIVSASDSDSEEMQKIRHIFETMNAVRDEEKPSTAMEDSREISQLDCSMESGAWLDVSRVQPLIAFPLIELGPACKDCPCFKCSHLYNCHFLRPSILFHCKETCMGTLAFKGCDYESKEK